MGSFDSWRVKRSYRGTLKILDECSEEVEINGKKFMVIDKEKLDEKRVSRSFLTIPLYLKVILLVPLALILFWASMQTILPFLLKGVPKHLWQDIIWG